MRHKSALKGAMLIPALFCATLLVGCRSDQSQAANVSNQFMEALKTGNTDAFKGLLTSAGRAKWEEQKSTPLNKDDAGDHWTVSDPEVKDNLATAPVACTDAKGNSTSFSLKLRKENGDWRVYAMEVPTDSTSITVDFEHPEAVYPDLMKAAGKEMGEGIKTFGKGMQAFGEGLQSAFKKSPDTPSASPTK